MDLNISSKTAFVTGSNRGTGKAIAEVLRREGVHVLTHGNSLSESDTLVDIIGDVCTPSGCEDVLSQLQEHSIDILVNNYGTTSRHKWVGSDTEQWLDMYQANVMSAARLSQGLMGEMKQKSWGRIINLGTIGSHQPNKVMPAYYAAKGALATVGVSLAKELSGTGVTVNTVAPGLILTEEVEAAYRAKAEKLGWEGDWEDWVVKEDFPNLCGRIARREEVADLVAFLCSERACFINAQNIRIDGGAVCYV